MRYTLALFQTHPLALFRFCGKFQGIEYALLPNREWNKKNKNIKNSLGATWNASHLAEGHAFGMLGDALIIFCLHRNMPKACPYVLIRKFSPRASQFQIIDNQYSIKIVGGRELSRPYRVWFFAEGERFLSFWRCHRPRWRGRRW